jgi:ABC-type uncharacterized transport system permease subunit
MYLALSAQMCRTVFSPNEALKISPALLKCFVGIALALHAAALAGLLFDPPPTLNFSFALAFSLMIWLAILINWLAGFHAAPIDALYIVLLPAGLLGAMLVLIFPQTHPLSSEHGILFSLHFLAIMLAYSLYALATALAVFMRLAETRLHRRRNMAQQMSGVPPLLSMESFLFRLLSIAFVLLSFALLSGIFYSETLFGKPLVFDHKTVFGILSWLIFGILLLGRQFRGWRGKIALRWILSGFVALMLAYVGSRFVLEVLLRQV